MVSIPHHRLPLPLVPLKHTDIHLPRTLPETGLDLRGTQLLGHGSGAGTE